MRIPENSSGATRKRAGARQTSLPLWREGGSFTARMRGDSAPVLVQLIPANSGVAVEQVYFERELPNSLGGQVLVGDHLYGTSPEGPAAVEFETGKIRWKTQDSGPGAVFYADGRLYFHLENGDVALVEATPEAYREKGRFAPAGQPKRRDSRERAWSYPVVANGRLYIRDLGHLWCYDVKQPAPAR